MSAQLDSANRPHVYLVSEGQLPHEELRCWGMDGQGCAATFGAGVK